MKNLQICLICVCAVLVITLVCICIKFNNQAKKQERESAEHTQSMILVETFNNGYSKIYEEPVTGTRYLVNYHGGICPIYNYDGTIHKF